MRPDKNVSQILLKIVWPFVGPKVVRSLELILVLGRRPRHFLQIEAVCHVLIGEGAHICTHIYVLLLQSDVGYRNC